MCENYLLLLSDRKSKNEDKIFEKFAPLFGLRNLTKPSRNGSSSQRWGMCGWKWSLIPIHEDRAQVMNVQIHGKSYSYQLTQATLTVPSAVSSSEDKAFMLYRVNSHVTGVGPFHRIHSRGPEFWSRHPHKHRVPWCEPIILAPERQKQGAGSVELAASRPNNLIRKLQANNEPCLKEWGTEYWRKRYGSGLWPLHTSTHTHSSQPVLHCPMILLLSHGERILSPLWKRLKTGSGFFLALWGSYDPSIFFSQEQCPPLPNLPLATLSFAIKTHCPMLLCQNKAAL